MQTVQRLRFEEARDGMSPTLDKDALEAKIMERADDGGGREAVCSRFQPHVFNSIQSGTIPNHNAPRAVVLQTPQTSRHTPFRVDHDSGGLRTIDMAHGELRIVGDRGADSDHDRINQRPQAVEVQNSRGPIDVV